MKFLTFTRCAVLGFALSASSICAAIINILNHGAASGFLVPYAVVALIAGGAFSIRAHFLWLARNKRSLS